MSNHTGQCRPGQSTVLAGIDGGEGSFPVLRASASYAELFGATLLAVHVAPEMLIVTPETAAMYHCRSPAEIEVGLLPLVIEALYDRDISWKLLAVTGNPAKALATLAKDYAAHAIIVGAHTGNVRNRLRPLSRSVTHRLTRLQSAPVIVIPITYTPGTSRVPWPDGNNADS